MRLRLANIPERRTSQPAVAPLLASKVRLMADSAGGIVASTCA